ncbi:LOW QUALITY PROTEIN: hypothetical protein Cgig2_017698 [Carnegiea gigantea]|uniref:Uncharacterized protein n=1 Tax=Carnegiea gigantea TaxID=171969 RepID=A0A9Q1GLK3_9CARY|nr:LOW QUALITY PROTEIN: hypothetical protein Cgig2_017698 [Carnegiea gigantea]
MSNIQGSKMNYWKTIFPSPDGAENIMDILDCKPNPTKYMGESSAKNFKKKLAHVPLPSGSHCFPSIEHLSPLGISLVMIYVSMTRRVFIPQTMMKKPNAPRAPPLLRPLRASQDVYVFDVDVIIREVFCTPFERLHYLKGELDSLYDLINERKGDATPLKNKVERLIHQACDLKDLQESYSNRVTTEMQESHHNELHIESTHYNVLKAKLRQGEVQGATERVTILRRSKKGPQLSTKIGFKKLSGQSDLKGQIDTLNAIKVIDSNTKASLEKTKPCIKESFEDLKAFQ